MRTVVGAADFRREDLFATIIVWLQRSIDTTPRWSNMMIVILKFAGHGGNSPSVETIGVVNFKPCMAFN